MSNNKQLASCNNMPNKMKTIEQFIAYYGETWGKIYFNESNPSYNFQINESNGY